MTIVAASPLGMIRVIGRLCASASCSLMVRPPRKRPKQSARTPSRSGASGGVRPRFALARAGEPGSKNCLPTALIPHKQLIPIEISFPGIVNLFGCRDCLNVFDEHFIHHAPPERLLLPTRDRRLCGLGLPRASRSRRMARACSPNEV